MMPNVSAGVGSESTCAGAGAGRGGAGTNTRSSSGGALRPTNAEAATGGAGLAPPHTGSIIQLPVTFDPKIPRPGTMMHRLFPS